MKVIKQLQVKFVYSMILIEMVVFAAILLSLNLAITKRESQEAKNFLIYLANNNGHMPRPKPFNDKIITNNYPDSGFINDIDATSSASRERPEDFIHSLVNFFNIDQVTETNMRNYFSVKVLNNGVIVELIQDFPLNYTVEEISNLTQEILKDGKTSNYIGGLGGKNISPQEIEDIFAEIKSGISDIKFLGIGGV